MSRAEAITRALVTTLAPLHLDVIDESHQHAVKPGAESHFKVVVVSEAFGDKPLVARHKLVYGALASELSGGLHALSITARTPAEWAQDSNVSPSPQCLGGSKKG